MRPYHAEVLIRRPIQEVFAYVSEPRNDPEWCPAVKRTEQTSGDGPAVGALYSYTHEPRHDGRLIDGTIEIVAMEPPRSMAFRVTDRTRVSEIRYELTDREGGTWFRQTSVLRLAGLLRLAGPIVRPVARRRIEQQARRLKRRLERTPPED